MNLKKCALSIQEYRNLANVLSCGISLIEALKIIENQKNHKQIDIIRRKLNDGLSIDKILFTKSNETSRFSIFNKLYPLHKAIQMCIEVEERERKQKKDLLGNILYSSLLIIVSMGVMAFGCFLVIPNMLNMLLELQVETSKVLLYVTQSLVVIMVIFVILAFVLIIVLYYIIHNHMLISIYDYISISWIHRIIRKFITFQYMSQYLMFLEQNLTTKEIQTILLSNVNHNEVYIISTKIQKSFESGQNFNEAIDECEYIDVRAKQFVKIGYITDSMLMYIRLYVDECKDNINQYMKYIIYMMQGLSYVTVAICVITITNMLFSPLQIIENI